MKKLQSAINISILAMAVFGSCSQFDPQPSAKSERSCTGSGCSVQSQATGPASTSGSSQKGAPSQSDAVAVIADPPAPQAALANVVPAPPAPRPPSNSKPDVYTIFNLSNGLFVSSTDYGVTWSPAFIGSTPDAFADHQRFMVRSAYIANSRIYIDMFGTPSIWDGYNLLQCVSPRGLAYAGYSAPVWDRFAVGLNGAWIDLSHQDNLAWVYRNPYPAVNPITPLNTLTRTNLESPTQAIVGPINLSTGRTTIVQMVSGTNAVTQTPALPPIFQISVSSDSGESWSVYELQNVNVGVVQAYSNASGISPTSASMFYSSVDKKFHLFLNSDSTGGYELLSSDGKNWSPAVAVAGVPQKFLGIGSAPSAFQMIDMPSGRKYYISDGAHYLVSTDQINYVSVGLSFYGFSNITPIDLPTGIRLHIGSVGQNMYTSTDLANWQLKYTATDIAGKTPAHPQPLGWAVVAGMVGARPFASNAVVPHASIAGILDYPNPASCISMVESYTH